MHSTEFHLDKHDQILARKEPPYVQCEVDGWQGIALITASHFTFNDIQFF